MLCGRNRAVSHHMYGVGTGEPASCYPALAEGAQPADGPNDDIYVPAMRPHVFQRSSSAAKCIHPTAHLIQHKCCPSLIGPTLQEQRGTALVAVEGVADMGKMQRIIATVVRIVIEGHSVSWKPLRKVLVPFLPKKGLGTSLCTARCSRVSSKLRRLLPHP